jgi:uncharacterized membrane protein YeaQ/YmgE (transglycosylase-associated protein family)
MMRERSSRRSNAINPFIWCAVGAAVGWAAGVMMKSGGKTLLVENMLVGVFGAFVGGDFVVSMLNHGVVNDKDFSIRSLAFAVIGAVVMLLLLRLVRGAVGPLRSGKRKPRGGGS